MMQKVKTARAKKVDDAAFSERVSTELANEEKTYGNEQSLEEKKHVIRTRLYTYSK